jgi:hypothetical protein
MIRMLIFNGLLLAVCTYALWRGRFEERVTAVTCILATIATVLVKGPIRLSYSSVEIGVLIVDLAALAAFTFVALRSDRFWPLWISGLQLTTSIGHMLKAIQPDLIPLAYAAAGRVWSYPILLILAIGTWRAHQRYQSQGQLQVIPQGT